jgi:hypothetical protein
VAVFIAFWITVIFWQDKRTLKIFNARQNPSLESIDATVIVDEKEKGAIDTKEKDSL